MEDKEIYEQIGLFTEGEQPFVTGETPSEKIEDTDPLAQESIIDEDEIDIPIFVRAGEDELNISPNFFLQLNTESAEGSVTEPEPVVVEESFAEPVSAAVEAPVLEPLEDLSCEESPVAAAVEGEPLVQENVSAVEELETEELLSMMDDGKPLVNVNRRRNKTTWKHGVLLYLHDLVYLLAAVIVIFLLLFRVVVVSGRSMNDTLNDGDYLLLLSNIFYSEPQTGDVIVAAKESFKNGAPIVKRVIAIEGQWVDIDFERGVVYVGDDLDHMVPLVEPYTKTSTTKAEGTVFPLRVEEGCIFVLGDNRDDSKDSRHPDIGLIDKREVMGKVIFLFFPGTNYGMRDRDFSRIGVVS